MTNQSYREVLLVGVLLFLVCIGAISQSAVVAQSTDDTKMPEVKARALSDYIAYLRSAGKHAENKEYDSAIVDYSKVILLARFLEQNKWLQNAVAPGYSGRAGAYLLKGEYEQAIADYTAAIALDPADEKEKDYSMRGSAYEALHEYELAIDDFIHSLTLNPNPPDVSKALADAATKLRDSFTAQNLFERVINFPFSSEKDMEKRPKLSYHQTEPRARLWIS